MSHGLGSALGATEGSAGGRRACRQAQRRPRLPGLGDRREQGLPLPAPLGVLRLLPHVPPHGPPGSLTAALGWAGKEAQGRFGSVPVVRVRAVGRASAQGLEEAGADAVGAALIGVGHLQGPGGRGRRQLSHGRGPGSPHPPPAPERPAGSPPGFSLRALSAVQPPPPSSRGPSQAPTGSSRATQPGSSAPPGGLPLPLARTPGSPGALQLRPP